MRRESLCRGLALSLVAAVLAGCAGSVPPRWELEPTLAVDTASERSLQALPPPTEPIVVAVYEFPDKTGQHKPNDDFPEYSRAVTQGAVELLIEALQEAGRGSWFVILEREGLENLLRERQLIRSTREQYLGSDGKPLGPPPPLLYAPIMIEGAIVAYQTNTRTGGVGARLLGVGANTLWEHDRVTVSVRASSTQNGRLLRSVSATKDIFSAGLQTGVFRFVEFDELLEIEAGTSRNEPAQLAVRRAIEKAVHSLILEGALAGHWSFADAAAAQPILAAYLEERDGSVPAVLADPAEPGQLAPTEQRSRVQEPDPADILRQELEERIEERSRGEEPSITDQPSRSNNPPPQNPR